jgi:hypothetical protein
VVGGSKSTSWQGRGRCYVALLLVRCWRGVLGLRDGLKGLQGMKPAQPGAAAAASIAPR